MGNHASWEPSLSFRTALRGVVSALRIQCAASPNVFATKDE